MRSVTRIGMAGLGLLALSLVVAACGGGATEAPPSPTPTETPEQRTLLDATPDQRPAFDASGLDIRTILPRDAIAAILDPQFITGVAAAGQMTPQELVIGLSINGDHRAYSTAHLSSHEVVNDVVGGRPIMVTW